MANPYNTPGTCGVYEIRCEINGKRYVGSSRNVEARWRRHQFDLQQGAHHAVPLQRAWLKYGAPAFMHSVLEICALEELRDVEQKYIDELKPDYNVSALAYRVSHTDETRAKMSLKARAAWACPERRQRQSERVKAQGPQPERGLTRSRWWADPDNKADLLARRAKPVYEAFGGMWTLKDLAETYDVDYGMLKDRQCAGWPLEHAVVTPKRPGGL